MTAIDLDAKTVDAVTKAARDVNLDPTTAMQQAADLWLFLAKNGLIGRPVVFKHETPDRSVSMGRAALAALGNGLEGGVVVQGIKGDFLLPHGLDADRTLRASATPFRGSRAKHLI